ncbi:hypothetical protein CRG98_028289 [Punica granatum]|uniref:Protein E6-like n=1 Tax=Punica granatum TaxID=22663 RepID=A0A2I0J525_PUNGR|nr:hypothetical protein CRG98_028289 [Punica granatum]
MASSTKQFLPSMSFLALLLLSCSCPHAHARESKFFSKAIHLHSTTKNVEEMKPPHVKIPVPPPEYALVDSPTPSPSSSLAPAAAPVAAPVSSEIEGGYGLYGHGSGVLLQEKETKTTPTTVTGGYRSEATLTGANGNDKFENEMMSEELNGESTEKDVYSNDHKNNYYYNNYKNQNVYSSNYHSLYSGSTNNRYTESYKGTTTTTGDNQYYYPSNYNANERQGMSDTRFLENGKYYYDVNRIDEKNAYQQANEKKSYMTESEGSYENESNRYDPNKSKYEFDSMEEYYKSQGYHLNNPEAYIP